MRQPKFRKDHNALGSLIGAGSAKSGARLMFGRQVAHGRRARLGHGLDVA